MPHKRSAHTAYSPLRRLFAALSALFLLFSLLTTPQSGQNPHRLAPLGAEVQATLSSLTRVDTAGQLYGMDYAADYYGLEAQGILAALRLVRNFGCSAFSTRDEAGHTITCRNYDFPHLDKNGKVISCSVVLSCAPEGKYRSLGIADALLFREIGASYTTGALDDGKTDTSLLLLLPWLTMDGMNEKGLCVSILYIGTKDGETPVNQSERGQEKVLITQLTRYLLDSCADVEEAVALCQSVNLVHTLGSDYHLFVSDASGASVVLEWRNNTLTVTETPAATNFYLNSDDACDTYYDDGTLHERFLGPAQTQRAYHYGYGNGYARFNTLVTALDGRESLTRAEAQELLRSVTQTHTTGETSETMYSSLYDSAAGTLTVTLPSNPAVSYGFSLAEPPTTP